MIRTFWLIDRPDGKFTVDPQETMMFPLFQLPLRLAFPQIVSVAPARFRPVNVTDDEVGPQNEYVPEFMLAPEDSAVPLPQLLSASVAGKPEHCANNVPESKINSVSNCITLIIPSFRCRVCVDANKGKAERIRRPGKSLVFSNATKVSIYPGRFQPETQQYRHFNK